MRPESVFIADIDNGSDVQVIHTTAVFSVLNFAD